jgi:hypothetical protein
VAPWRARSQKLLYPSEVRKEKKKGLDWYNSFWKVIFSYAGDGILASLQHTELRLHFKRTFTNAYSCGHT